MKNQVNATPRLITRLWRWWMPIQVIIVVGLVSFVIGVSGMMSLAVLRGDISARVYVIAPPVPQPRHFVAPIANGISPVFTAEVQHWSGKIVEWAKQYDLDPNMLATIMQIESCGDWQAGSSAGAQGLFQVMPFHFTDGEDSKDPDTNARAGVAYLKQTLSVANGHFGLALAGYNGGASLINAGWARWPAETKRYYTWGSGIYLEATQGAATSATLQDWLDAGGIGLCRQAAARISGTPIAPTPVTTGV